MKHNIASAPATYRVFTLLNLKKNIEFESITRIDVPKFPLLNFQIGRVYYIDFHIITHGKMHNEPISNNGVGWW